MKKYLLKAIVPICILLVGVFSWSIMPSAVASSLPKITTINATVARYSDTVKGDGTIVKSDDGFALNVAVNENNIRKVVIGQFVKINGVAFPEYTYSGEVIALADTARYTASNYVAETVVDVMIKIVNPDKNLRPGYTATALIETTLPKTVSMIPYNVILQDGYTEYVLLYKGGVAERSDIITGVEMSNMVEVIEGISLSDNIIQNPKTVEEGAVVIRET